MRTSLTDMGPPACPTRFERTGPLLSWLLFGFFSLTLGPLAVLPTLIILLALFMVMGDRC